MLNKNNVNQVLVVVGLVAMVILGGCAVSSPEAVNGKPGNLKVMTYNIHHAGGMDGKLDLDRIGAIIAREKPDIVGLNEVDNNFAARSDFLDEPKLLAEKLAMHYVYAPTLNSGDAAKPNQYGNALLSKFPIKKWTSHKLYRFENNEPRICIEAVVNVGGADYTVMVTHLDHRSDLGRAEQARDIIELLPDRPMRTILVGDFNAVPPGVDDSEGKVRSRPISIILEKLKDSFVLAGAGEPGSNRDSSRRIDYVFVSEDLAEKVVSCETIRTEQTKVASDHKPVVVVIEN
ncbi:MAG: endonuclease/exonuclease/phosphatase family protein [Sedimentisphaerales bacterium]|nr:endonuclease/exonuclease/phosphatase family protein [Sedimentisphaerales bacterium]